LLFFYEQSQSLIELGQDEDETGLDLESIKVSYSVEGAVQNDWKEYLGDESQPQKHSNTAAK